MEAKENRMTETAVPKEELKEYLHELNDILGNDENRRLLMMMLQQYSNSKMWPSSYYHLRDTAVPVCLSQKAAKAFFWYIFIDSLDEGTRKTVLDCLSKEVINYLEIIRVTFTDDFLMAKKAIHNPYGLYKADYTYSGDEKSIYITRNDRSRLMIKFIDTNDEIEFLENITLYYAQMKAALNEELDDNNKLRLRLSIEALTRLIEGDADGR